MGLTCKIKDCEFDSHCRGWCNMHYKRWRKYGNPQTLKRRKFPKTCPAGHRFDRSNTIHNNRGYRVCLTCKRFTSRVYARQARAEGRADAHRPGYWVEYKRQVREGERVPKRRVKPHVSITAQILDLLEIEGTWMTPNEVADRLNVLLETARTTLNRLRTKGQVQSQRVDLTDKYFRTEFRYLTPVEESV